MKDKYRYFISALSCMWFMILTYDGYMWFMIMVYGYFMWFMILMYDGCVFKLTRCDMLIHDDLITQLVWLVVTGSQQDCKCTLFMSYQWGMIWVYFNLFWI